MTDTQAIRDEISTVLDALSGDALAGYAQREAPAEVDEHIAELIRLLALLTPGEREQILYGWFEPQHLEALTLFAMRMTALAVEQSDVDLLRSALVALAFEGFRDIDDDRVADALLETVREAAVAPQLSVPIPDLVGPVLALANPGMGEHLRRFFDIQGPIQEQGMTR